MDVCARRTYTMTWIPFSLVLFLIPCLVCVCLSQVRWLARVRVITRSFPICPIYGHLIYMYAHMYVRKRVCILCYRKKIDLFQWINKILYHTQMGKSCMTLFFSSFPFWFTAHRKVTFKLTGGIYITIRISFRFISFHLAHFFFFNCIKGDNCK